MPVYHLPAGGSLGNNVFKDPAVQKSPKKCLSVPAPAMVEETGALFYIICAMAPLMITDPAPSAPEPAKIVVHPRHLLRSRNQTINFIVLKKKYLNN
jgi:hypothetical protein